MSETAKMRAIGQDVLGGPDVLHEIMLDRPTPGPSELLVRVHAAGLNPTDWKHRANGGFESPLGNPPFILGWDVSGVVDAVGFGVTLFAPGDEVFGMLPYPYGVGAFAQYVTAPARSFARKPSNIDHVHAGALPVVALTAWQALVDTANVRAGQRVLIHAAAGGVGHVAVQIAKARGAYVIGTASEAKHEFVRELGADELVDYRSVDFADVVSDVDVAFDAVGGDYALRSLQTLRKGGIVVTIVPGDDERLSAQADELGLRAKTMLVEADHAGMQSIADLIENGKLRVEIADVFPFEEAAKAHALGETNRTTGKIVLTVP
jgi:NADPH:quinone reductase-like Zn-dependent oxidoreductase